MSDKGADLLRARVSEADRLRRSRAAAGRLWRIAPAAAAVFVAVAIAARLAGWAPRVTIGTIAVGTLALLLVIVTARRPRPVSDTAAAEIDAHANLDGELRSAHWFAQHASATPGSSSICPGRWNASRRSTGPLSIPLPRPGARSLRLPSSPPSRSRSHCSCRGEPACSRVKARAHQVSPRARRARFRSTRSRRRCSRRSRTRSAPPKRSRAGR